MVIVERDTKAVQVFTLTGDTFVLAVPAAEGGLTIPALNAAIRTDTTSGAARLALRLAGEPETLRTV